MKKILRSKIRRFQKIYFAFDFSFIEAISFLLFIENVFIKIKNSIFPQMYTRYEKNVEKQNCLFQKDLQL